MGETVGNSQSIMMRPVEVQLYPSLSNMGSYRPGAQFCNVCFPSLLLLLPLLVLLLLFLCKLVYPVRGPGVLYPCNYLELLRLSERDVPCEVKSSLNLIKKSASQLLVYFENLVKKNIVGFASVLVW